MDNIILYTMVVAPVLTLLVNKYVVSHWVDPWLGPWIDRLIG